MDTDQRKDARAEDDLSEQTEETPLHERVGFDYIKAIRDLLKKMTYEELAFAIGYNSTGSITAVLKGRVPSHVHGEALWALYLASYGCKPPLDIRKSA